MRTKLAAVVPLALALALVTAACSKSDSANSGDGGAGATSASITIKDLAFAPTTLTGSAGETLEIAVANDDSVEHSFTLDDDSVSKDIEGGESATVQIKLPASGSVGWHCEYHPQMTGTITVA